MTKVEVDRKLFLTYLSKATSLTLQFPDKSKVILRRNKKGSFNLIPEPHKGSQDT